MKAVALLLCAALLVQAAAGERLVCHRHRKGCLPAFSHCLPSACLTEGAICTHHCEWRYSAAWSTAAARSISRCNAWVRQPCCRGAILARLTHPPCCHPGQRKLLETELASTKAAASSKSSSTAATTASSSSTTAATSEAGRGALRVFHPAAHPGSLSQRHRCCPKRDSQCGSFLSCKAAVHACAPPAIPAPSCLPAPEYCKGAVHEACCTLPITFASHSANVTSPTNCTASRPSGVVVHCVKGPHAGTGLGGAGVAASRLPSSPLLPSGCGGGRQRPQACWPAQALDVRRPLHAQGRVPPLRVHLPDARSCSCPSPSCRLAHCRVVSGAGDDAASAADATSASTSSAKTAGTPVKLASSGAGAASDATTSAGTAGASGTAKGKSYTLALADASMPLTWTGEVDGEEVRLGGPLLVDFCWWPCAAVSVALPRLPGALWGPGRPWAAAAALPTTHAPTPLPALLHHTAHPHCCPTPTPTLPQLSCTCFNQLEHFTGGLLANLTSLDKGLGGLAGKELPVGIPGGAGKVGRSGASDAAERGGAG